MIKRTIKKMILESIENKPVTLITGARQVGKTTLCYDLIKSHSFNYVSLDDINERKTAINDPLLFLKLHPCPLIIDEVQYAPELFPVIQSFVNEEKFKKGNNSGMFVLTGSQAYKLMQNVTESMAGRISIIRMSPLSVSEIKNIDESPFKVNINKNSKRIENNKIDINQLYKYITRGFYPELYANEKYKSDKFYSDYVQSYINRDVSELITLKDKLKFQNFLEILASLTGEELVYDNLAKLIGVSMPTIQAWVSILVSGDIIHLLQPYNEISIVKRVVKRPKIYFCDTGLACYLSKLSNPDNLKSSYFNGRFVETYIVNEIMKSYKNNGKEASFYYYRDSNQNEIDLIILNDGILQLIECKSGVTFSLSDVKAFKQLERSKYKIGYSCIICNSDKIYSISENVVVLPISSI